MRKTTKLLTLTLLVLVAGATATSTALAQPPSSGTPTLISPYYGTVLVATSWPSTGAQLLTNVYIFSTAGPFYVQKVNVVVYFQSSPYKPIYLEWIYYDGAYTAGNTQPGLGYYASCAQITSPRPYFTSGDIISVAPSTLIDPSGATAIPAAKAVEFTMTYAGCPTGLGADFPSGTVLSFEATVLAPQSATVSICANEGTSPLFSCKS